MDEVRSEGSRGRRKALIIGAAVVVAAAGLFAFLYFEPDKLFVDDEVDEARPAGATEATRPVAGTAETTGAADTGPEPTQPAPVSAEFRGLDHSARGRAVLLRQDNDTIVRFEEFEVQNGPDLKVYLSAAPADGPGSAFDDDFVDLGTLKGNVGDQNYVVPVGIDLARYRSVVIWCRRFSVGFAVAPLP